MSIIASNGLPPKGVLEKNWKDLCDIAPDDVADGEKVRKTATGEIRVTLEGGEVTHGTLVAQYGSFWNSVTQRDGKLKHVSAAATLGHFGAKRIDGYDVGVSEWHYDDEGKPMVLSSYRTGGYNNYIDLLEGKRVNTIPTEVAIFDEKHEIVVLIKFGGLRPQEPIKLADILSGQDVRGNPKIQFYEESGRFAEVEFSHDGKVTIGRRDGEIIGKLINDPSVYNAFDDVEVEVATQLIDECLARNLSPVRLEQILSVNTLGRDADSKSQPSRAM